MIRTSIFILFLLLPAIPSLSQSYVSAWKYQIELQRSPDGAVAISYSIQRLTSDLAEEELHNQSGNPLPVVNNNTTINMVNLMMPANDKGKRNFLLNPGYLQYQNPVITIPSMSLNHRFPDPTKNEYYPMPEQ